MIRSRRQELSWCIVREVGGTRREDARLISIRRGGATRERIEIRDRGATPKSGMPTTHSPGCERQRSLTDSIHSIPPCAGSFTDDALERRFRFLVFLVKHQSQTSTRPQIGVVLLWLVVDHGSPSDCGNSASPKRRSQRRSSRSNVRLRARLAGQHAHQMPPARTEIATDPNRNLINIQWPKSLAPPASHLQTQNSKMEGIAPRIATKPAIDLSVQSSIRSDF